MYDRRERKPWVYAVVRFVHSRLCGIISLGELINLKCLLIVIKQSIKESNKEVISKSKDIRSKQRKKKLN